MKKNCIIFLMSIIISLLAVVFAGCGDLKSQTNSEYLRIHIRADSNQTQAQEVKYIVKDEVVKYLTPLTVNYKTQMEAVLGLQKHLPQIELCANQVLKNNGYDYGVKASIREEYFPTRVYQDCTLAEGVYTALIIELGSGEGDNWWCVVYPPLCFSSPKGEQVIYKSKILEIIQAWKTRQKQ